MTPGVSHVFRQSATKSGRPYGVTSASSLSSCRTPRGGPPAHPWGLSLEGRVNPEGEVQHYIVTWQWSRDRDHVTVGGTQPLPWVSMYTWFEMTPCPPYHSSGIRVVSLYWNQKNELYIPLHILHMAKRNPYNSQKSSKCKPPTYSQAKSWT